MKRHMTKSFLWLMFFVMTLTSSLATAYAGFKAGDSGSAFEAVPMRLPSGSQGHDPTGVSLKEREDALNGFSLKAVQGIKAFHRLLTAEVQKIDRGLVFVKTQEGTKRSFSLEEAKDEGVDTLRKGDLLTLEVDEGNLIIDIHRVMSGLLDAFDAIDKKVTIRLDGGKTGTFEVKTSVLPKLNRLEQGQGVALEIDEEGRVMDAYGV